MPQLDREGAVFLLDLGDGENRLSPRWLDEVEAALDEVCAAAAPRALVTTATGKTWSQGLDLAWLAEHPGERPAYLARVQALLARVLTLPVPCVAAVQGHCYAAGAMLALAHDSVVMRADRGFFCLPEIDIGLPFTPGMSALVAARLTPATAHEAMTTGRRYGGVEALTAGVAAAAEPEDRVRPAAVERAAALAGKDPATLGQIKRVLYARVLEALTPPAG